VEVFQLPVRRIYGKELWLLENAESIPGKKHSNTLALREAKPVETVKQVLNIGLFLSELVSR
jgi:hypothetical protein